MDLTIFAVLDSLIENARYLADDFDDLDNRSKDEIIADIIRSAKKLIEFV